MSEDSVGDTPHEPTANVWEPGDKIQKVPGTGGVGRWRSYDTDLCTRCDLEFEEEDALDAHLEKEHPKRCMTGRCRNIASYRRGAKFSTGYICVKCLYEYDDPEPLSSWYYLTNEANAHAPLLPEDHPVEKAIRGLYGTRDEAREAMKA